MTEEAAQAKRLFDGERWAEAALILKRVVDGETGRRRGQQADRTSTTTRSRSIACSSTRRATRSSPRSRTSQTTSSSTRPCSGCRSSRRSFPSPRTSSSASASTRPSRSRGSTTRSSAISTGSSTTCSVATSTAIATTKRRSASSGRSTRRAKYFVQAQFFSGISYVQRASRCRPSSRSDRIVKALDEGVEGVEDESPHARPRVPLDGAHLLLRVDSPRRKQRPKIDAKKLSAAVKYWNRVDVGSEYWLDALFEQSWAYFMAGDYPHALGNIHTIESPYFPNAFYPESDVLKAVIAFTICQYEDATTIVAKHEARSTSPSRRSSRRSSIGSRVKAARRQFFDFLKEVRAGKANLSPRSSPSSRTRSPIASSSATSSTSASSTRRRARFKKAPPRFKNSPVGGDVTDALNSRATSRPQRRHARPRALPALPRRARRAPSRRIQDPHRHHGGRAQQARSAGRQRPAHEGRVAHVRRRQARRRARPLAVRRRILARRARLLPPGRHVEVRQVRVVLPVRRPEIAPTRSPAFAPTREVRQSDPRRAREQLLESC
jgi:hypothetical protein